MTQGHVARLDAGEVDHAEGIFFEAVDLLGQSVALLGETARWVDAPLIHRQRF